MSFQDVNCPYCGVINTLYCMDETELAGIDELDQKCKSCLEFFIIERELAVVLKAKRKSKWAIGDKYWAIIRHYPRGYIAEEVTIRDEKEIEIVELGGCFKTRRACEAAITKLQFTKEE